MSDFTTNLSNIIVASTNQSVLVTGNYQNITASDLRHQLTQLEIGEKDGGHFLRTGLQTDDSGKCLPRANNNAHSLASLVILDCDKRYDSNGVIFEGAPDPQTVSDILRDLNICHILYGTYSHYAGNKGNRYRILIPTNTPHNMEQLAPTIETIVSLINSKLDSDLLFNSTENNTWAQPWFYPRKPVTCSIAQLYIEHSTGVAIEVVEPIKLPEANKVNRIAAKQSLDASLSPIEAFNQQNTLADLLRFYGYKRTCVAKDYERWISPNSSTGTPGIILKGGKFFSHHGSCQFNDGYWHDAFDLMRVSEGLSERDAIIKAAQTTHAPDGSTVDEHNKSLAKKPPRGAPPETSNTIVHAEILNKLLAKIQPVDFRITAELKEDEKLKRAHFQIITVETILETARLNNWGLCRNYDFIYIYNGEYWGLINADDLKLFLGKAAEKMGADKFLARDCDFREKLFKQFMALAHLPKPEKSKDVVLVNLNNGTFEVTLTSTQLRPFDPNDFLIYQLPFSYDPGAECPMFQAYLDKVQPNKQLQNILSEYIGYVFIPTRTLKLEKALILYGQGANGKSVFYEIVRSLFGEHNTSEYSLETLTDSKGYQRAMIANKLVNYASEINGKLETSVFKQLVSGEPVEARLPYGNPLTITDYAKLIFNCNELPKDVEQTEAFFRRFLIVLFNVTIPPNEQDKRLASKIIDAELPGVLNWALNGLKRLLAQSNFSESEEIHEARRQYENGSDTVKQFLDEANYKPSSFVFVSVKTLYKEYRDYAQDNGNNPVNKGNFKRRLENAKILVENRHNNGYVAYLEKQSETAESITSYHRE